MAELEAESATKKKRKARKGKGRATREAEASRAEEAATAVVSGCGGSGAQQSAEGGLTTSDGGAHKPQDDPSGTRDKLRTASKSEAAVGASTASAPANADSTSAAREALQAASASGDLEALCSAIEEQLAVADPADLTEARAARSTLRKRKKKEEKAREKVTQTLQALTSADDIDGLESALQMAEDVASAAEMAAARSKLERLKVEARAIAKARTIEEIDTHFEKLQVAASQDGGAGPSVRGTAEVEEDGQCVVCLAADKTHAFVPCGHICVCGECCDRIMNSSSKTCPLCRQSCQWGGRMYK